MGVLLEPRGGQTARVQVAALAQRDKFVRYPLEFLGFRQGRLDLLMLDQGPGHVGEHGLAVLVGAVQLAVAASVTHFSNPFSVLLCPAAPA